ncbi:MAG: hypothetical protein VB025_09425 [Sphaerochaeta sp.]|jgi:hypothetical protein|nr:hypothetical protein [Sphaerochaeta sp.]PKL29073.1 MAG: hypothetical protein CVV46_03650 [Spirochaetae bacterium HGW-Spirochaetae-2]
MQKQREKSPTGIIVISALATMLVLVVLSYVLITYVLPYYKVSAEILYSVLIRLLPIIIGLILVQIAIIIHPPQVPKDTDQSDTLEKDDYTRPLYNLPREEDSIHPGRAQLPVEPASAIVARETKLASVEIPEIKPFAGKQPVMPTYGRALPVELEAVDSLTTDMEIPPSVEEDQLLSETDAIAVPEAVDTLRTDMDGDIRQRLSRAVLFSEYPFPIVPGSDIARLLEPIDETEVEDSLPQVYTELIEDTFEDRLQAELESAIESGYELSVAIIEIPSVGSDPHSVDSTVVQNLFNKLGVVSLFYLTETRRVSAILPFHGFEQSRRYFAALLENLRKNHPLTSVKIGFTSLHGRILEPEALLREASIATDLATERSGYNLIGYDSNLETDEEQ